MTLGVIIATLAGLARGHLPPSLTVLSGTIVLMVAGVVDTHGALSGFGSPAPITVAALFVLGRAVEKTGVMQRMVAVTLGYRTGSVLSLMRLLFPVAAASAFLNNTPIVATLAPAVRDWAERTGCSPSRYLMPLSFAAILGGVVTTIGTSTNLIVSGLLVAHGEVPLGMFEIAKVGLPLVLLGVPMVALAAPRLLPERLPPCSRRRPTNDVALDRTSRGQTAIVGIVAILIVAGAGLGIMPILHLALLGAVGLIIVGVLSPSEARQAVNLDIIVVIAAAFGLGAATQESGLAAGIGRIITDLFGAWGPRGALCGVVLTTIALMTAVTNNATAVLMFPIAMATAQELGLNERTFAIGVAVAASGSFLTPIAYQTNLIVYRSGGYRFGDYARLGFPLTILLVIITLSVVPIFWPLR